MELISKVSCVFAILLAIFSPPISLHVKMGSATEKPIVLS